MATAKSDHLVDNALEDGMTRIPGRVATEIECTNFNLWLHRKGSRWIISYRKKEATDEWKSIREAGLYDKLEIVYLIPNILAAMVGRQRQVIEQIIKASEFCDQQIAALPAPEPNFNR